MLDGVLSTYSVPLENEVTNDPLRLLKDSAITFSDRIVTSVNEKNAIKFYLSLHLNFCLNTDESFVTDPPIVLNSNTEEVYRTSDIDAILKLIYENLCTQIEDFERRGSGWVLDKLVRLDLHILEFAPLRGQAHMELLI